MKIVVLDGHTLNPGDLSWDGLADLGQLEVYPRSTPKEVVARAQGAAIVLTNKIVLSGDLLSQLAGLRYVGVLATGYNIVDIEACGQLGVTVTNIPTYGTESVAQMVFAHLLNLTQRVGDHAQSVRDGEWAASEGFCYWRSPLIELSGLTLGVVGLGRIGMAVARIARGFNMSVQGFDPSRPASLPEDVAMVELDHLFAASDVITLHCPLTDQTHHLVNRERLASMRRSAFLINTSRGPLVDEVALAEALEARQIAGAGLDVLEQEPPIVDNRLVASEHAFVTPHIAWATYAARQRLMNIAVDNVRSFLEGSPRNVVRGNR